jgi:hypothetical protein
LTGSTCRDRLTTSTPHVPAFARQATLHDFLVRPERRQLPDTGLISFSFFDFTETVYAGLSLGLYPISSKMVSTN